MSVESGNAGIYNQIFSCESVYSEKRALLKLEKSELFEMALIVSGAGIHRVLDKDIPCKKGDIFIIPPNIHHEYFIENKTDVLTVRQLFWDGDQWLHGDFASSKHERFCYGVFHENTTLGYATLNTQTYEKVSGFFDLLESEISGEQNEWQEIVSGILSSLLIIVSRYINASIKDLSFASRDEWNTVSSAIKIIREEYDDPSLTLNSVAERLYLSRSHFSRMFSRITGKAFSDYLRDVRIKNVCRLLEKSDANVEDIARKCGFNNMPSFYKNFGVKLNMTPNKYRKNLLISDKQSDEYIKLLKGEKMMGILNDVSENLQKGKAKMVKELVQQALDEGVKPADILEQGLLDGMGIIGEKFKNNEVYVPEVLVAARAMNMGAQILKPHLAEAGVVATGKVCIGTVQGDLHDIGKNLVKMMMEGKGLEVVDLGTDVAAETFVQTAIEQNCQVICCSALLTTTMGVMADVVKAAEAAGIRGKVKIMVGGAPVSDEFCAQIGADCYTVDAASAADAAVAFCK